MSDSLASMILVIIVIVVGSHKSKWLRMKCVACHDQAIVSVEEHCWELGEVGDCHQCE